MPLPPGPPLQSCLARGIVVAYRENVDRLARTLADEGIEVTTQRQTDDPAHRGVCSILRCLLNHAEAWKIAAESEGLTLVMEADFVPCRGFGRLPLPFDPAQEDETAWAYLYAGGPRIYERRPAGHLLGHACGAVAYVMSPHVARLALRYVGRLRERHPDWSQYHAFDTELQWHLMGDGARAYVPWRQYGEHGGWSNPEHYRAGMGAGPVRRRLARAGVGLNHYADRLVAPLAFLPAYAGGRALRARIVRLEGWLTGALRLLAGQTVAPFPSHPARLRRTLWWHCARRLL